jgi:hypothetical protein
MRVTKCQLSCRTLYIFIPSLCSGSVQLTNQYSYWLQKVRAQKVWFILRLVCSLWPTVSTHAPKRRWQHGTMLNRSRDVVEAAHMVACRSHDWLTRDLLYSPKRLLIAEAIAGRVFPSNWTVVSHLNRSLIGRVTCDYQVMCVLY